MTEYTTYVAFDGVEFENENDCLAYERELIAEDYCKEIFLYDINREPIPLYAEDFDDVRFINVKTEKACQWFIDRCNDCYSKHPWKYNLCRKNDFPMTGFFWFDINGDCWRHWQTEIEKLNEIRNHFQLFEED